MTGAGMAWTHAQIVGCLRWTGWWVRHVHGDGLVSGQAGLDRPGQASECTGAGVCRGARARIEVKKQSPGKTATVYLPPPLSRWQWGLVFGTVIKVQLGSEASGP